MSCAQRPLVQMRGIDKIFRAGAMENHVLSGVSLDVHRGEFLCIAGPSGCGKTTLLSLMGLLDVPSGGELLFDGHPIGTLGRRERARLRNGEVGFVFQSINLIGDLSVADNVGLPLALRGKAGRDEREARVEEVLARVGMSHRMRHYPSQLSGGQQQRVAVARALVGDPSIVLADEPTGNLDVRNGDIVMALLRDIHSAGRTVCIVSHDARVRSLAERTLFLLDGHVVDEQTFRGLRGDIDCGIDDSLMHELMP